MIKKIFITADLNTTIVCDKCGKTYKKNVSKFIGHKRLVKLTYNCKCGHSASVILERRRFVRKPRQLQGSIIDGVNKIPIIISDLSRYGLKVNIGQNHSFIVGDNLCLEFSLDDLRRSKVTTHACIKRVISPISVGCEFIDDEHYNNLGKYFLFYF